jgi:hypothetical protein
MSWAGCVCLVNDAPIWLGRPGRWCLGMPFPTLCQRCPKSLIQAVTGCPVRGHISGSVHPDPVVLGCEHAPAPAQPTGVRTLLHELHARALSVDSTVEKRTGRFARTAALRRPASR